MVKRSRGNKLERWEVALVKAMQQRGGYNDQDILAYFTRPSRSINHRVIAEIRTESKHRQARASTAEELDEFLACWPDVDQGTGLSLRGDELLIKAREAMIAAVHIFNSAGLTFRSELFIVTAVISWTYLMHAWFKKEGIDYRYKVNGGAVKKTQNGEDCYWELGKCLRHQRTPLEPAVIKNLEFLIKIRHEIEHRATQQIDNLISAKLQACCLNFNEAIKRLFGARYSLEERLPIALQFVSFSEDQRGLLKKAGNLPQHIQTTMNTFYEGMSEEELANPSFAYRVAFVPKIGKSASNSDVAVEFVKAESNEAKEISRILLQEIDKRRYTAKQIVEAAKESGYPNFNMHHHTVLWKSLNAKQQDRGYGKPGDYAGTWVWFDRWLERVKEHCAENQQKFS
ncbi:hypothetical protein TH9_16290 [Thalassospira xiamenensis]|uniref:DUF3644 domain-containing protein n=1 Tax=Thalassospira xiamenensis TaxID=220697 RepID=UPI000DED7DCD|nr:DUF3644 domain-containing protein [Thalassospira xiamenensis]RCK31466.1 hypothetical protein TH9_16290 [Thalassospira xiamenensis]